MKKQHTLLLVFLILLVGFCSYKAVAKTTSENILNGKKKSFIEPSFTQFKGEPKKAILHLIKVQKGECVNALYRSDVGFIDIVWGENNPVTNVGFGLKHIIEKHGKEIKQLGFNVEDFVPIIVQFAEFNKEKSFGDKLVFEQKNFRFVLQTKYKGIKKQWLLTAFDLKIKK